jgi:hypothetical protein
MRNLATEEEVIEYILEVDRLTATSKKNNILFLANIEKMIASPKIVSYIKDSNIKGFKNGWIAQAVVGMSVIKLEIYNIMKKMGIVKRDRAKGFSSEEAAKEWLIKQKKKYSI